MKLVFCCSKGRDLVYITPAIHNNGTEGGGKDIETGMYMGFIEPTDLGSSIIGKSHTHLLALVEAREAEVFPLLCCFRLAGLESAA